MRKTTRYLGRKRLVAALAMSAALALPVLATAKVAGPCSNCHTMHNSQDGLPMGDADLNGRLLTSDCIGCHTGDNVGGTTPYVLPTGTPTYGPGSNGTLAGGSFYWVNQGEGFNGTGHNVITLPSVVLSDMAAPGGTMPAGTLTCAGTNGCHGVAVENELTSVVGGHHGSGGVALTSDSTKFYSDGTAGDMSKSFRMLDGIEGIEDDDWEYTATVNIVAGTGNDHNLYKGVDRTVETDIAAGSISALCARCHPNFHSGSGEIASGTFGTSPWLRHPTDFDMGNLGIGTEYAGYADYNLEAPVAVDTLSSLTQMPASGDHAGGLGSANATNSAIVTCISCHRAHGSPYDDLLRWNYAEATIAGTGCINCHTTKG